MHTYLKRLAQLRVLASHRPRRGGDVVPLESDDLRTKGGDGVVAVQRPADLRPRKS